MLSRNARFSVPPLFHDEEIHRAPNEEVYALIAARMLHSTGVFFTLLNRISHTFVSVHLRSIERRCVTHSVHAERVTVSPAMHLVSRRIPSTHHSRNTTHRSAHLKI